MSTGVQGTRRWLKLAATVTGAVAVAASSVPLLVLFATAVLEGDAPAEEVVAQSSASHAVLNGDWEERITKDATWRAGRSGNTSWSGSNNQRPMPSQLKGPPPPPSWFAKPPQSSFWGEVGHPQMSPSSPFGGPRPVSGYRTVCVRLCDGYFFPISFGVSEGSFSRDQATCSNSCPGARLYHYRPGSEDPESMVDSSGQPYSKLKNANLFRTQFVESCKCKPNPWEQEAVSRHRIYALEEQHRKGNRAVVAELAELKGKNRIDNQANNKRRLNDRRRQEASAEAAATTSATTVALSATPRSDASRGQGGDRGTGVMTGSIATEASAATVQSVTSGQQANQIMSGSAIEPARSMDQVPKIEPVAMPSFGSDILSLPLEPIPAPEPQAAPEPGMFDLPTTMPDASALTNGRQGRNPGRRDGSGSNSRYDGSTIRQPEPRRMDLQPRSRSAEWTSRVFAPF